MLVAYEWLPPQYTDKADKANATDKHRDTDHNDKDNCVLVIQLYFDIVVIRVFWILHNFFVQLFLSLLRFNTLFDAVAEAVIFRANKLVCQHRDITNN